MSDYYTRDYAPMLGCSYCASTTGVMGCPHHGPQAKSLEDMIAEVAIQQVADTQAQLATVIAERDVLRTENLSLIECYHNMQGDRAQLTHLQQQVRVLLARWDLADEDRTYVVVKYEELTALIASSSEPQT